MERDWVAMKVDREHMKVTLTLKKCQRIEKEGISVKFVEDFLKENGIVAGINKEAIQTLISNKPYGTEIVVAEGKVPEDGVNGHYKFLMPIEDMKAKPKVNPDGSVDYANSLEIAMVKEGELVAVYQPATRGKFGYTVYSEMLNPVPGKEHGPLNCRGLVSDDDYKEYRARFTGRIYRDRGKIVVDKVYVVNGDVDVEHGNIHFNGDVEVKGDVRGGLEIHSEGNIYVHGHVSNCRLFAEKNITIKKGVQGKYECEIVAKEDVAGNFMERCRVKADGNVYANSLLDCDIYARKRVIVMDKRACIIGGTVTGMMGVTVKNLGNEAEIGTIVHFGEISRFQQQLNSYLNKLKKVRDDISLLEQNLYVYEHIDLKKRTKETEEIRMKLVRAKVVRTAERNQLNAQIDLISEEIAEVKKEADIKVLGTVYPGVVIMSEGDKWIQREAYRDLVYRMKNERIEMLDSTEFEMEKKRERR